MPELARVGAAALGQDGRVLEQEQDVAARSVMPGSGERALERERLVVGNEAEPNAGERVALHPSESGRAANPARRRQGTR